MTRTKRPTRITLAVVGLAAVLAVPSADARRGRGGDDPADRLRDRFEDSSHGGRHGSDDGYRHRGRSSSRHDEWWLSHSGGARFELEAHVVAVDLERRLMFLDTGVVLAVPFDTPFHPGGDIWTFDGLLPLAGPAYRIEVEGWAERHGETLIAHALKVELDD